MRPSLKYGLSEIAALGFSDPEGSVFFPVKLKMCLPNFKIKKKNDFKNPNKKRTCLFLFFDGTHFFKKNLQTN